MYYWSLEPFGFLNPFSPLCNVPSFSKKAQTLSEILLVNSFQVKGRHVMRQWLLASFPFDFSFSITSLHFSFSSFIIIIYISVLYLILLILFRWLRYLGYHAQQVSICIFLINVLKPLLILPAPMIIGITTFFALPKSFYLSLQFALLFYLFFLFILHSCVKWTCHIIYGAFSCLLIND